VRDLRRQLIKLGRAELYAPMLQIMARIVRQQRGDKNKVYSLHVPEVSCIAKGKAHKQYEFGSKVSVASLSGSNVVVGITSFVGNPHDGKTVATSLDAVAHWTGQRYARVLVDKGHRGHGQVGGSSCGSGEGWDCVEKRTWSRLGEKMQQSSQGSTTHTP
jgi:transposase, IS5 family